MVERPTPRRGISDIAAYVPGKASAPGAEKIYKLSSNESALGVSSAAAKAFADEATNLQDYPDGSASNLRQALAIRHGINADRIICGNGSDEILSLVASTFLEPGDEAIHCEHGFLVYPIAIRASGATPVVAQEKSYAADIDAILAAVTAKTKLVFLANPNNPTGTYVPFSEVQRLHAALPNQTLLVLDAAYAEFVRKNDYQAGIELAGSAENVLMTRTFSKIYGLAGARLGWAYGAAHIIDMMHRVRGPFNVNRAAIAAGVASLNDREFLDRSIEHNEKWLPWCKDQLQAFGLEVTPSIGNFLLIHFPDIQGKRAADADAFLLKKGVILRQVTNYGLPNALRMSIGSEEANRTAISFIGEFLAH